MMSMASKDDVVATEDTYKWKFEQTQEYLDKSEAINGELQDVLLETRAELQKLRDFSAAQSETSLKPDFDPTLGGVPYPGMNKSGSAPEFVAPIGAEIIQAPQPEKVQP